MNINLSSTNGEKQPDFLLQQQAGGEQQQGQHYGCRQAFLTVTQDVLRAALTRLAQHRSKTDWKTIFESSLK